VSKTLIDTVAFFGLPLVLLSCLAVGIVSKGRIGRRPLVFAAVAAALYVVVPVLRAVHTAWRHGVSVPDQWGLIIIAGWLTLAVAVLVYAALSVHRRWPFRRLAAVLGAVMPLPVMLLFAWGHASVLLTGRP
jgi:hypothetical protein